ncbi:MAG: DUF4340 domain-containing protein [Mariprofundaceae bacterium]
MRRAAVLLLILVLGAWAWWKAGQPARGPQTLPTWPAVEADAVRVVEIAREGAPTIRLERADDGWTVRAEGEAHAADAAAVRHLIEDLTAMRPVRVVSRGTGHDRALGLAPASRVHVRLLGADGDAPLLELWIGSQAADLVSTHVRLGDEGPVVAVGRTLRWQVMRSSRGWRAPEDAGKAAGARQPGREQGGEGTRATAGGR